MFLIRFAALLSLAQVGAGPTTRSPADTGGLAPGPWPVGFIHLTRADSSRPLSTGQDRLLDIGVWYPAHESSKSRLTYRDYFLLTPPYGPSLPGPDASRREFDEYVSFLQSHGAPGTVVQEWMNRPMLAAADAQASGSRYPLVLIAQGNGETMHDQAALAEYLASYGYVVATAPSPMRITGPLTDEKEMGARADEQALDLGFVRESVADRPDVIDENFGVVAHSFGARAALLLAMRDSRVVAVVSLDGGIGTATGRTSLEAVPSYRAGALRAPILHFYEELDAFMAPDFGLLRSLTAADRWLISVPALHHHHFTSLGAVSIQYPQLRPAILATAATAEAYASVARATLEFLDAFTKDDRTARGRFRRGAAWPNLGRLEQMAHD